MPGTNTLRALLALFATTAALSGCGSDEISGEIPAENAGDLQAALADVRGATEQTPLNCEAADTAVDQFVVEVNALPADPSAGLKPDLQVAANNLRTLVSDQCASSEPTTTTTPTTTTPTTAAPTTSSTTTDTTTTDTTTDTTTTTDEQPPPGNDNGGGPPSDGGTNGGTGGTGGGDSGD